jgi:hypothetical protein
VLDSDGRGTPRGETFSRNVRREFKALDTLKITPVEKGLTGIFGNFREPAPSTRKTLEVTMRVIKSLLLGAAAGLAATAGVQAADMPVKAKAVEYVKICSAYGAGFYYIPGSDICLRVGGAVRPDY